MTFHTVLLKDPGDLAGVGNGRFFNRFLNSPEQASLGVGAGLGDFFVGQQLLNCQFQVLPFDRASYHARRILVVDSSAITDLEFVIQNNHFGSSFNFELISNDVVEVLPARKINFVRRDKFFELFCGILLVAADAEEAS